MKKTFLFLMAMFSFFGMKAQSFDITYGEGDNAYTLTFEPTTETATEKECSVGIKWIKEIDPFYGDEVITGAEQPNVATPLVIPATVENEGVTYTVTSIRNNGFSSKNDNVYCTNFSSLTLPNTITSIGTYAFYKCTGLTGDLIIPNKLTEISDNCFQGCNFSNIILHCNVTSIGSRALRMDSDVALKSVTMYGQNPPTINTTAANSSFYLSTTTYLYRPKKYVDNYSTLVATTFGDRAFTAMSMPTFTAESGNSYNTYDNWTDKTVPSSSANVVIDGELIIAKTDVINVGNIGLCNNGSITIKDGGQLYHNNPFVTAKVQKSITGFQFIDEDYDNYTPETDIAWYTISSPLASDVVVTNVSGLTPSGEIYDLYRYDEENYTWHNYRQEGGFGFTTLEQGRGYLYAMQTGGNITFNGVINNSNVEYELSAKGEKLTGFNLIGNPFTHNITGSNLTVEDGMELASGYYALSFEGNWGAKLSSTGTIKPCQGILVKTNKAGTLTINKAGTLTINKTAQRSSSIDNGSLALTVSNEKYSDVAYVAFSEGMGLDKIKHQNVNIPMIYIPVENTNYAIANMSEDVATIAVNFEAMTMGEYTISAKAQDCKFNNMTLIDNMTGEKTNLLTDSYTFMATTSDSPDRFTLTLNNDNDNDFIYIHNNEMIINNIEGNGLVQIYDMMGRSVATYNVSGSANISMETLSEGVYIVRMTDANGVKTQKVVNN